MKHENVACFVPTIMVIAGTSFILSKTQHQSTSHHNQYEIGMLAKILDFQCCKTDGSQAVEEQEVDNFLSDEGAL